ncbi:penicillin-binding protein 1A [Solimicrobium silvestre]|uniref:Penicillin-binding protein 1A n=1 Tax=Solimicrobium silvestre TaxID=2099400 RepID=A0A2S9H4H3_9BURK|nr:PBP1A family penicillin-binding protein [Solimicrobium silvestre]PRC94776.1 Penicillin-binding protein, 1A family [Solimicrobium silvestre]
MINFFHPLSTKRFLRGLLRLSIGLFVLAIVAAIVTVALLYPSLPELDSITSYRPKMPLRVFSADEVLLAEFGDERRNVTPLKDIPLIMKQALLAVEDQHFYEHNGIYIVGNFRALLHNMTNFSGGPKQGASTITQQVARNFFLTNEQTYHRKIIEALLTYKIEKNLTKDQILELYMNQIYLGQRAYGFASAAQIYFGKKLQDITPAEAAMLAGLPKSPARINPITNYPRAKTRQLVVLQLMRQLNYITEDQYQQAKVQPLLLKTSNNEFGIHAEYVAELARQAVQDEFKADSYTRGINVYTTILKEDQIAAYTALRKGVMDYEKRHAYRGPEAYLDLPDDSDDADELIETAFSNYPANDDFLSAVVLESTPKKVVVVASSGEEITITGGGLSFAASGLANNASSKIKIKRGAVLRVIQDGKNWSITQLPEVESAFVAADTNTGAIRALVGGFDFKRNQFNHVTQAWRQPGSTFKPFIYSASLEKGFTPATIINDAPLTFDATQTGGLAWEPKNSDDQYDGPITMREALAKSKNMVSIQILENIGVNYGQEFAMKFGFDADKNPPYLPLALGAGAVTPLQMAAAYAVFANGGYKIKPYLISKITDASGTVLHQTDVPKPGMESNRIISEGNAFMMDNLLKNVVKNGSASRALVLNRPDLAGKTGTTNNAYDAWFAGYQSRIVAVAWIGFDQPKNLGSREFGGGLALPIWISYMQTALLHQPIEDRPVPPTVSLVDGDYSYTEPPTAIVRSIGVNPAAASMPVASPVLE